MVGATHLGDGYNDKDVREWERTEAVAVRSAQLIEHVRELRRIDGRQTARLMQVDHGHVHPMNNVRAAAQPVPYSCPLLPSEQRAKQAIHDSQRLVDLRVVATVL